MDLQDGKTPFDVGCINGHLTIKAAWTQQGGIQHIRTVGGRQNDDAAVALKAIHLSEQLIEGLFALIVSAADTSSALTANGINFVNKDQAGGVLFGPFEQIAHTAGTNTNKHLHELRT